MSLKRFTVNRFTTQRFTVPGFGTGGGSAPAGPTSYTAVQVFTASQTWTPPSGVTSVDYMVIAGGGGGGGRIGGGGGAGGYREGIGLSVTPSTSYTIAVGSGGAGAANAGQGSTGFASNLTGGTLSLAAPTPGGYGGTTDGTGGNEIGRAHV